jgi:hypothetical protein
MRAKEFLAELKLKNAPITKRQQFGTRGLHIYSDGERWNTDYTMNRLGMAVAGTDGVTEPDIDPKSWVGKHKTVHPYTQEESDMLKMAYKTIGANYKDLNGGDMDSEEPPGGNTESPIKPFQGYPR